MAAITSKDLLIWYKMLSELLVNANWDKTSDSVSSPSNNSILAVFEQKKGHKRPLSTTSYVI